VRGPTWASRPWLKRSGAAHSAVRPGYHLNRRHSITVALDGSLPDELVFGLIEDSYELVVDGLPKRERDLVRSHTP
jgi:predicted DNA-binding protein (MmcQ/YjbR family)